MSRISYFAQQLKPKQISITPLYETYIEWLKSSQYGDKFVYYKGNSPGDSMVGNRLARVVFHHYKLGLVHPTRQRKGSFNFDFIAIRSSKSLEHYTTLFKSAFDEDCSLSL